PEYLVTSFRCYDSVRWQSAANHLLPFYQPLKLLRAGSKFRSAKRPSMFGTGPVRVHKRPEQTRGMSPNIIKTGVYEMFWISHPAIRVNSIPPKPAPML